MKSIKTFESFIKEGMNVNMDINTEEVKGGISKIFKINNIIKELYLNLEFEEESYVDVIGDFSEDKDKDYLFKCISEFSTYISSLGWDISDIILSDSGMGDEVTRKTITSAKKYSDKHEYNEVRLWLRNSFYQ